MFKNRMWFLGDKSFKQVGKKKSSMKKRPGCSSQQWVAFVTDALEQHHLLTSGLRNPELGWQANPAVSSWFSSPQASGQGKKTSPLACGRERPNYHASDFPLEGWRQGLNSAPPQFSRDTSSWKASAVTLPPPHTQSENTDGCQHQPWPGQHPHSETRMERQEDSRWLADTQFCTECLMELWPTLF